MELVCDFGDCRCNDGLEWALLARQVGECETVTDIVQSHQESREHKREHNNAEALAVQILGSRLVWRLGWIVAL